ncbi:MAG: polyphosphate polymerase domain-containing protein [Bdellovibrionota bacterium]
MDSNSILNLCAPERQSEVAEERFSRIEEKLLLPNSLRDDFIKTANKHHMVPCYPDDTTVYSLIESTYFDSQELRSFTDHFQRASYRFKLRGRKYGPNGHWPDASAPMYLELKTKSVDICDKVRIKIDNDEFVNLKNGGRIARTNKIKTVKKINDVFETLPQSPTCKIVYRRYAYEQDNLRITIDDQIKFQPLKNIDPNLALRLKSMTWWPDAHVMSKKLESGDYSLVEVKHIGILPLWLQNYMNTHNLVFQSFSKYCYAISNLIQGELR